MESQTIVEQDKNLYLYCFFRGPACHSSQVGIDGVNSTFVLSRKDLCALVSCVSKDAYNEHTLNRRIQDLDWLIPKVKRHEQIVRCIMDEHTVMPIRFGTLYQSCDRVLRVLERGYEEFAAFLDEIRDKEEWGVKVYAEQKASQEATASENKRIEQLDAQIANASPGKAHLLKKKKQTLLRQQDAGLLDAYSDQIYQRLLAWAVDGRRNRLLDRRMTGKTNDMILHAAFLIRKQETTTFLQQVNALTANSEDNALSFELSGPWPCYNFCPEFQI